MREIWKVIGVKKIEVLPTYMQHLHYKITIKNKKS